MARGTRDPIAHSDRLTKQDDYPGVSFSSASIDYEQSVITGIGVKHVFVGKSVLYCGLSGNRGSASSRYRVPVDEQDVIIEKAFQRREFERMTNGPLIHRIRRWIRILIIIPP